MAQAAFRLYEFECARRLYCYFQVSSDMCSDPEISLLLKREERRHSNGSRVGQREQIP